jgi:hypothetical protein
MSTGSIPSKKKRPRSESADGPSASDGAADSGEDSPAGRCEVKMVDIYLKMVSQVVSIFQDGICNLSRNANSGVVLTFLILFAGIFCSLALVDDHEEGQEGQGAEDQDAHGEG